MKTFFSMFAMVCVIGAFMACGNSAQKEEKSDNADAADKKEVVENKQESSQQQDVVAEEEDGKNATETRGEADSHKEGFGRCLASGCYCKAFEGRGQTCRNCGHAYRKHY